MITGVHALIYTKKANSLRAFFRDVLDWPSVDAREGWLIFAPHQQNSAFTPQTP